MYVSKFCFVYLVIFAYGRVYKGRAWRGVTFSSVAMHSRLIGPLIRTVPSFYQPQSHSPTMRSGVYRNRLSCYFKELLPAKERTIEKKND